MFKQGYTLNSESNQITFNVFAYQKNKVSLIMNIDGKGQLFPMKEMENNVYSVTVNKHAPVILYKYSLDVLGEFPDPYSNYQPNGVHGFSQVIDHREYSWNDQNWKGIKLENLIIMEIHIGCFTPQGTFQAAIDKLPYIKSLGINAIELMPINQTPGRWNWGYDGTGLFTVNSNYGTPNDLKAFIDKCHKNNLAVLLDVVYNHFGPEGNYMHFFGPYFTKKHKTPWGPAINYDDKYSLFTRNMIIDNVQYWLDTFHFDGLRLDAVHAIKDSSANHIIKEIRLKVKEIAAHKKRPILLTAESDKNDIRLIKPNKYGGLGIDAQWMDDFHHCIHTILTGENKGYYQDYGNINYFKKVFKNFLYTGQFSRYLKKKRGTNAAKYAGKHFIVSIQNHDQIGNRAYGDRLSKLVAFPYLKAAAGLMLLSPYIPLLFMGEEYGESNPFLFFTDYQDLSLQKQVYKGRKMEFSYFGWDEVPNPQYPQCFDQSKLTEIKHWQKKNHYLHSFYKDLIKIRKSHPILKTLNKKKLLIETSPMSKFITLKRWNESIKLETFFNLGNTQIHLPQNSGKVLLSSDSPKYGGNNESQRGLLNKGEFIIYEKHLSKP